MMQGCDDTGRGTSALFPRAAFDLVVMAASAGGVAVLKAVLSRLPTPFGTPIAIVQHVPALPHSFLSDVLGFRSRFHTKFAQAGDRLRTGMVFVAPPDRHLTVSPQRRFELDCGPKLHSVRPAADRLFVTAAMVFGSRVLCVVLTGMGRDGAAGAALIKHRGGVVIVQDPKTAAADPMPCAAIRACDPDLVLPPEAIPSALVSLCDVAGARASFCHGPPEVPARAA